MNNFVVGEFDKSAPTQRELRWHRCPYRLYFSVSGRPGTGSRLGAAGGLYRSLLQCGAACL